MVIKMDLVERLKKEVEETVEKRIKEAKLLPDTLEAELREIGERYIETAKDIEALHKLLDKDIAFSRTYDLKDLEDPSLSIRKWSERVEIRDLNRINEIPYEEGMKVKLIIYKE